MGFAKKAILRLRNDSGFSSVAGLVDFVQSKYPKSYFYKPIGVEVELTNLCNLQCEGCPIIVDKYKTPDMLTLENVISFLYDARKEGMFAYSLTGGEVSLKFNDALKVLSSDHGLDIYKYNTNGSYFKDKETTIIYLKKLQEAGFGSSNKYIKPVLVVSIGQQNVAGVPLINAVHVTSQFYSVFKKGSVIFSLNITEKNLLLAKKIYEDFLVLYKKQTGEEFSEDLFQVRFFSLNNIPTLRRLHIPLGPKIPVKEVIDGFATRYLSGGCFNIRMNNTLDDESAETLIPRCVLRPNGDIYACPGYTYTHKIGNVLSESLHSIIKSTNRNAILKTVFTKNLDGLYRLALRKDHTLKDLRIEQSYGPCDVCKLLSANIRSISTQLEHGSI